MIDKLILLYILIFSAMSSLYQKVNINQPQALCLDGTQPAFYYHAGNLTKIMISFQGGGWCGSETGTLSDALEDCYQRSSTYYGSSSTYASTITWSQGIMSDNKQNMFNDWSIFYLRYCTGTAHQGHKTDPISYKGKKLYFRGQKVVQAFLQSLVSNYDLLSAAEVVVTGGSAGGLATFLWANRINQLVGGDKTKVIADSGIFLDFPQFNTDHQGYRLLIQSFMKLANDQVNPPNTDCVYAHFSQKWKCLLAQYNWAFVMPPLFVVQSMYDSWCLPNILSIHCLHNTSLAQCNASQMNFIEQYHGNTTIVLEKIGSKRINGVWAPACCNHGYSIYSQIYSYSFAVPQKSEYTAMNSIKQWYYNLGGSNIHSDAVNWPNNHGCSGSTPGFQQYYQ